MKVLISIFTISEVSPDIKVIRYQIYRNGHYRRAITEIPDIHDIYLTFFICPLLFTLEGGNLKHVLYIKCVPT